MSRKLPISYPLIILIFLTLGGVFAFRSYLSFMIWGETSAFNLERHAFPHIVNYLTWGLLMPLAVYVFQRWPFAHDARSRVFALLASFVMACFLEIMTYVVYMVPMHILGIYKYQSREFDYILRALPTGVISRWIEYWILYGLFMAYTYYKESRNKEVAIAQMENQLSNAQLRALRYQLQPHFLFNTLNTISSLMEMNVKQAQTITSKLGNLLRTVLDYNTNNVTTLQEELDFIRSYLDIEQVRFQDRLEISYDIEEKLMPCQIPSLILQPLVENAIKHGVASQSSHATIDIIARSAEENMIEIVVEDNGNGTYQPAEILLEKGIGLKNTKKRLDHMYRGRYGMQFGKPDGAGFRVSIKMPCSP